MQSKSSPVSAGSLEASLDCRVKVIVSKSTQAGVRMDNRMYKMEISVEIDESERQRLIDTAREYYGRSGRVCTVEDDETEVHLSIGIH